MAIPLGNFSGCDLNCELFPLIAMHVIMQVVSSIERKIAGRIESEPDFTGIVSTTPPVKSLNPSERVPYLSASYEPCNLLQREKQEKNKKKNNEHRKPNPLNKCKL